MVSNCVLVRPDFEAARHTFESKRPFEFVSDASDYGWCCVLTQREREGGTPRVIAVVVRSLAETQMRWGTFEREFFSYSKLEPLIKGFFITVWIDHLSNT